MNAALQLGLLTALLGALAGTGISAAWWSVRRDRLADLAPQVRLRRLLGIAALPVLGASLLLLTGLAPSILDALGLASDHCHAHPDHHHHLCLVHASRAGATLAGWLPLVAASVAVGGRLGARMFAHWRTRSRLRRLIRHARPDDPDRTRTVPTDRPLAATTGLFDPTVLVSDGLRSLLGDRWLEAVEHHERTHAQRYHGLVKLAVGLLSSLHLPAVGRALRREVAVATEQIADREAARAVGDPLTVAEALLAYERKRPDQTGSAEQTAGFGSSELERRIRGLLDQPWEETAPFSPWSAFAPLCTLVLLSIHRTIHHALETILSYTV